MDILQTTKKGQFMHPLERYHIFKSRKIDGNILNDTYAENESLTF
jgi:hypothetical protein